MNVDLHPTIKVKSKSSVGCINWRATREKGLSDVCVKCRFGSACAVRTG